MKVDPGQLPLANHVQPTMPEARRFRNSRTFGTRGAESGHDPVMTTTSSARLAVVNAWIRNTFRSMRRYNYRVWAAGAIVSNTGTWMQRIAQDWLVLTPLTQHSGTSVGIVMSLPVSYTHLRAHETGRNL